MKHDIFLSFIFVIIMFYAVGINADDVKFELSNEKPGGQISPGEMIIEIGRGIIDLGNEKGAVPVEKVKVNSGALTALNKKHGLVSIERLFSGVRKGKPSDIYVFGFLPKVNIEKVVSDYKNTEGVVYVEPNYRVSAK